MGKPKGKHTISATDGKEINRTIAFMYNEGHRGRDLCEHVNQIHNSNLTTDMLQGRLRTMKLNGTLDSLLEHIYSDDELINEIFGDDERDIFRVATFDIETTSFKADFGYILCGCFYDMAERKFYSHRLDETDSYKNRTAAKECWQTIDKELCTNLLETYKQFDVIIHYNGRGFDNPFVNTKLTKYRMALLPPKKQVDLYQVARWRMKLGSNRLDSLCRFLGIGDNFNDGHAWENWQMAANGLKEGFDKVEYHCKRDVAKLAAAARRMRSHIEYLK